MRTDRPITPARTPEESANPGLWEGYYDPAHGGKWHYDEHTGWALDFNGADNTLRDESGHGNHGTLVNMV